jgi:hypothetical protein
MPSARFRWPCIALQCNPSLAGASMATPGQRGGWPSKPRPARGVAIEAPALEGRPSPTAKAVQPELVVAHAAMGGNGATR